MKLALIDYGSGNIHSVSRAISHAAEQAGISLSLQLTDDPDQIYQADRIILPGVGHFADCYQSLSSIDGLVGALTEAVISRAVPFLGICVGMQLLADCGREGGDETPSLGWIGGIVDRLPSRSADGKEFKIPHMGWNSLDLRAPDHAMLADIEQGTSTYFVHSYYYQSLASDYLLAVTDYSDEIPAIIGKDNIIATQFHPEKSQQAGQKFLHNFLRWQGQP
jgi:glutamine amidotransferase